MVDLECSLWIIQVSLYSNILTFPSSFIIHFKGLYSLYLLKGLDTCENETYDPKKKKKP